MANHDLPILGGNLRVEAGIFPDLVKNQITAAAAPSIGEQFAYVMNDGGSDVGFYGNFHVPQNYVGTPVLVIRGILDGAPGASDTLGFGLQIKAVADNEAADGAYGTEQVASATIGSSGSSHSDEDLLEETISLTAGDYTAGDDVGFYFFLDTSGTSYTGNFLLLDAFFRYADA